MADLLDMGARWLEDQRHRHMTKTVTYQRGAESVDVQATVGRTVFEQSDDLSAGGVVRRTESRDFLVRGVDLVLGGQRALPRAGDRIREPDTEAGRVFVYEVSAPGASSGAPVFGYADPCRCTLRIHTTNVDEEQA